jgi:hypothetical protein
MAWADRCAARYHLSEPDLFDAELWFDVLVRNLISEFSTRCDYTHVLNTVDEITLNEATVEICGVCSPFVRSDQSPAS